MALRVRGVGDACAWLVERSRNVSASFLAAREVVRVAALQGRPVATRVASGPSALYLLLCNTLVRMLWNFVLHQDSCCSGAEYYLTALHVGGLFVNRATMRLRS